MDAEERKKLIYDQVGPEALNILKQAGINIDDAVARIIKEQETQSKKNVVELAKGDLANMMTSELVYKSIDPEDDYAKEHSRRISSIGFGKEQASKIYEIEKLVLSVDAKNINFRDTPWAGRYFIFPDSTPETMPEKEFLALSELILITDDANSAFWRDHHVITGKAWQALCMAASCAAYTSAIYGHHFNERTEKLGWSKEQTSAYIRNECMLLERLKWGLHENPAWTPASCELAKYRKI